MLSSADQDKPTRSRNLVLLFISVTVNLFLLYSMYSWKLNCREQKVIDDPVKPTSPLEEKDTIILLWFWPFGRQFDLTSCSTVFNIQGCSLTGDRKLYSKAHAVLIHHRDIASNMSNLPKQPRPVFQKWIWMHFESPRNTKKIPGLENLFNVTMNYRRDADITVREQMVLRPRGDFGNSPSTESFFSVPLKEKDKLVCWIVSNWNSNHDRVKYYEEFKKFIKVDTYGRAFHKVINQTEYNKIIRECKFYLSFENTKNYPDYITEKLFNPLTLGTVPVVLGPPRYTYEQFVPGFSFIHVDDFESPKALAEYLLLLGKNEEKYKEFFRWQQTYEVKHVDFPKEHACLACKYIRERNNYQVFKNLNKWYWEEV
ncbi:alpha-(1,3)-fucosyltransferase 9-like [Chanos chanos]|uniref:Fucosyltransferase n=1 Tax=Chanos chanos TaxID=29144 RepID=A0A6J2WJS8_CHACN|nr:alpha-(1,3)-fucosyltransferase 9-like [Chanos chanos]XP_030645801.1 alpha-(1,3)-fucosyltransferase 9-like [Chanos chanos]